MSRETRLIRVAVGIIKRGNKILIAERPLGKPYSGYWEFPGGKVEADEDAYHALQRELQEELGICVRAGTHWFDHAHTYPDKTVLLHMWLVDDFTGELQGAEGQTLRWVTLPEMREARLLEGNWPILERLVELFEGTSK